MRIKIQQVGIYETLVAQLDRIFRHNRQGSFHTKRRYYEAMKRFCAYLADVYHLQKLSNISGKHLVSYVIYLQDTGKSASTIKTDLAAIRFFHDKMDHKYTLPSNDELGITLERRRFGQDDRTWSNPEFSKITDDEYDALVDMMEVLEIDDGFIQDPSDDDVLWIPDFSRDVPFPESFADPDPYFLSLKHR